VRVCVNVYKRTSARAHSLSETLCCCATCYSNTVYMWLMNLLL